MKLLTWKQYHGKSTMADRWYESHKYWRMTKRWKTPGAVIYRRQGWWWISFPAYGGYNRVARHKFHRLADAQRAVERIFATLTAEEFSYIAGFPMLNRQTISRGLYKKIC
jgi:hypothetical protein